ncbi:hypothetical protein ABTH38_19980, partial [Acinetobacter baumannii]
MEQPAKIRLELGRRRPYVARASVVPEITRRCNAQPLNAVTGWMSALRVSAFTRHPKENRHGRTR